MQEGLVILSARYGALEAIRKAELEEQGQDNGAANEGSSSPEPSEPASSRQARFTSDAAGESSFSHVENLVLMFYNNKLKYLDHSLTSGGCDRIYSDKVHD